MFLGVVGARFLGLDVTGENIAVPLLATHILWINLLTDAAPALALGVDPPVGDTMDRPPRRATDRIIDGEMQLGVAFTGAVMAVVTLLSLDLTMAGGMFESDGDIVVGRTMAFTTLVLAQLFNAFASRSARLSALTRPFSNRLLWAAVGLSLGLQILVVHLPVLRDHAALGRSMAVERRLGQPGPGRRRAQEAPPQGHAARTRPVTVSARWRPVASTMRRSAAG